MLTILLAVVLMIVFYIAVIVGQPQEDEAASTVTPRQDQPLLTEGSDMQVITDASALSDLLSGFPAPALTSGSSMTLLAGLVQDVAYEDGYARMLTLTYQASDEVQITLTSIYPARALSLLEKGDYRISSALGPTMAGLRTVRMDSADAIRLHAQGEEAIYVLVAPRMDSASLRTIAGLLTLTE